MVILPYYFNEAWIWFAALIIIVSDPAGGNKPKTKTSPDAFIHTDLVISNLVLTQSVLFKQRKITSDHIYIKSMNKIN